jgi:hypothetical protein
MDNNWTNDELQDAIQEVLRRSTVDSDFRSLALRDAATAISRVTSKPLSSEFTFKFVDNSGAVKTIALPDPVLEITQD